MLNSQANAYKAFTFEDVSKERQFFECQKIVGEFCSPDIILANRSFKWQEDFSRLKFLEFSSDFLYNMKKSFYEALAYLTPFQFSSIGFLKPKICL